MNKSYIEYLNTFGAKIDVGSQSSIEVDALSKEHIPKENKFEILSRLLRYKCHQFYNTAKDFTLDMDQEERRRLIDSIERLKYKVH